MRMYPELDRPRNRQILGDASVVGALAVFALFAWAVHGAVMSLTSISKGFTDNAQGAQDSWNSLGESMGGIPFIGDNIRQTVQDLAEGTLGRAAETGQTMTDAVTLTANVLALVTFAAPAGVMLLLWLPRRLDRARRWDAARRVLSPAVLWRPITGAVGDPGSPAADPVVPGPEPAALGSQQPPVAAADAGADAGAAGAWGQAQERAHAPEQTQVQAQAGAVHDTVALPWGRAAGPVPGAGSTGMTQVVAFPAEELLALRALCHLPFEDLIRYAPRPFEAFTAGDYAPLVEALYAHEGLRPPR